jgi:hypothetical protein
VNDGGDPHVNGHGFRGTTARLLIVVLAAAGLVGVAVPAQARAVNWAYIVLPGGGDAFDNYDYPSPSCCTSNVDWPVNLFFWNNATISKVKGPISGNMPAVGSTKYAWIGSGYDSDGGRKQAPGNCTLATNYHFRVYAPSSTDRAYNTNYGYFVIGTSHNDYREGCTSGDRWFGDSENAESFVAGLFRSKGYYVSPNSMWLNNYEAYQREGAGLWNSNGYATLISIP